MRQDDEDLIGFCVEQYNCFSLRHWHLQRSDRMEIAALLLLGSEWYGHRDAMSKLCDDWQLDMSDLPMRIKASQFDVSRFLSMLRKCCEQIANNP